MARPQKDGLDYFPVDVDFYEDEKVELISAKYGSKGEVLILRFDFSNYCLINLWRTI